LNYNNSRTNKEQNDTSYKPEITNDIVKRPNMMLFIWAILFLGKLFSVSYRYIWKNMIWVTRQCMPSAPQEVVALIKVFQILKDGT